MFLGEKISPNLPTWGGSEWGGSSHTLINHGLTRRKSAELASRWKIVRREPERDGKILRIHRQDGTVAVGGIGNLAR